MSPYDLDYVRRKDWILLLSISNLLTEYLYMHIMQNIWFDEMTEQPCPLS